MERIGQKYIDNIYHTADTYDLVDDKHAWAFYYYCKRKGDDIRKLSQRNGRVVFNLIRKEDIDNGARMALS